VNAGWSQDGCQLALDRLSHGGRQVAVGCFSAATQEQPTESAWIVLGNARSAGNADCQTMKYAMEMVISVEKVFLILEVVSECRNMGAPAARDDLIRKSLVEHFANFVV
jgi:hypothetical protein